MTNFSSATTLGSSALGIDALRGKWGWILALGAVYLIAGMIALSSVVTATIATVYVVGIMMIVAGVSEIIGAFQMKSWGKFIAWIFLGALYVIAGFSTFESPLFLASFLTMLIWISLLVSGLTRVFLAFSVSTQASWVWVFASGVLTALLGAVIFAHWPVSSLYILGLFLGCDLVVAGLGWISLGFGLRSRA